MGSGVRTISAQTSAAWLSHLKIGKESRPMARVTVQPLAQKLSAYDRNGKAKYGRGQFASMAFGQTQKPVELPNVKSVTWTRSTDQDIADCTVELWNTEALPLGRTPVPNNQADFGQQGFFSPDRGDADSRSRWQHVRSGWQDWLVPDRIIRTFEGYGFDVNEIPENDPHMYQSGVWLIDDVDYTHDGMIRLRCRDLARELVDEIAFPPVIPFDEYNHDGLIWEKRHIVEGRAGEIDGYVSGAGWKRPRYQTDSSQMYLGSGFSDGGAPYIQSNGSVRGHHGRHAFDKSSKTYWMSVGNEQHWSSAYEWVQGKVSGTVHAIRVKPWGGPYTVYVSVFAGGKWRGRHKVPYRARAVDAGSDIPYVTKAHVGKNGTTIIKLPKKYKHATKIRVTFGHLYNSHVGQYRFRAGAYKIEYSSHVVPNLVGEVAAKQVGNYDDLSDIVRWFLAWAGFHWPEGNQAFITDTAGNRVVIADASNDNLLPVGSVWGDFEATGTTFATDMSASNFDKKPILDCIKVITDLVGYIGFVDEYGGYVWRSPNVWKPGNYVSAIDGGPLGFEQPDRLNAHTSEVFTLNEDQLLFNFTLSKSSQSRRDKIFVANTDGTLGAVANGPSPIKSGTRRVAMWTDAGFKTSTECQVMADLISLRMLFRYETGKATIAGCPAIQVDDQIRIEERVTAHAQNHYVKGITSTLDNVEGTWRYELTTHSLGSPSDWKLTKQVAGLSPETKRYLSTVGKI